MILQENSKKCQMRRNNMPVKKVKGGYKYGSKGKNKNNKKKEDK